jgi:hypothetical protein
MSGPLLVIAIDFGAHASGFAYTSAAEHKKPASERAMSLYRDWPGGQVFKYFKTRTALLRSASGEIIAWGNEAWIEYAVKRRRGMAESLQFRENFKLDLTSEDSATRKVAVEDAT